MEVNGKYSIGILLTFVLLAAAMLYSFPVITLITGIKGITATSFFLSRIVIWIVLLIVFLYSIVIEKGSFLLKKENSYSVLFYIKAVLSLYFICLIGGAVLNAIILFFIPEKISDKLLNLVPVFRNNYFLIISTCLTAAVAEEFLMRGYIQPRIEKIYNNPTSGIIISAILFGILHSTYGTIGQVLGPFFIGIVFALFYKRYSNIKILIICHFMIDFISLMALNFINIKHLSVF
ncbi:CPBP family intramembrane metalloprotease (plasmid) [Chryseobacterium panacisoli]|uniref:CPBP family intramembrane metalloprotease n=1 Tax=Chryseobacterium panacisoli TaxID=1807141 RepID=A0A5D8ZVF7_9FLAO|nr:type II CAAX endopeptidase family protein [Chryseobacterium panacisoli]TZF98898.1 CPBP family intramembrane metalloprotease [Chryseobacterium panacisoli]